MLRDFIENLDPKMTFWSGCAFYELTDEEENISEDKELIFQKKV